MIIWHIRISYYFTIRYDFVIHN